MKKEQNSCNKSDSREARDRDCDVSFFYTFDENVTLVNKRTELQFLLQILKVWVNFQNFTPILKS